MSKFTGDLEFVTQRHIGPSPTLVAALIGAICFSGCTTFYEVKVISDPPGARIEVNEDYIGTAPASFQAEGDWMVRVFVRPNFVRALPLEDRGSGFTLTKTFQRHSQIPRVILFDMSMVPPAPPDNSVKVDIDQKVDIDEKVDMNIRLDL